MGNKLFGVDIASIIAKTVAPGLLPVTIYRISTAPADPANLTGGPVRTAVRYKGTRGIFEDIRVAPPGVEVKAGDKQALLIGDTIPAGARALAQGDFIEIEGAIMAVEAPIARDPAAATYKWQTRDRGPNPLAGLPIVDG